MLLEPNEHVLRTVSYLSGWLYFMAWSVSFYPQPILNFKRHKTEGLTPDYPILNLFGFTCYTISTASFLYSPSIRSEYAARHPTSPQPTVRFNDFAFGLHAWVLCGITLSQFWPTLWGWLPDSAMNRRASVITSGLIVGAILGTTICVVTVLADSGQSSSDGSEWEWIDVIYAMTYVKLLVTFFKYIPQVVANHQRKSTLGWSINQVLLDSAGGIFSLVQLVLDSSLQPDWSGLTGNPVKLGLANVSLLFDIVFLVQHYLLYGPIAEEHGKTEVLVESAHGSRRETEPLLGSPD